ncbi:MAG: twin-arginine translocation signal domain-containing protein [Candidatus Nitrosocosmicus sp.]
MSSHPSETDSNSEGKISRREFLKYIGATGAIPGLSSLPFIKTFADLSNGTIPQTNILTPSESKQMSSTSPHTFNLDSFTPQLSNTWWLVNGHIFTSP